MSLWAHGNRTASSARRGFTLTELAIVLGVVGAVLAAIWVSAAQSASSRHVAQAASETMTIIHNYRNLYAMHNGIDTATAAAEDVTCLGVHNGFFPNDMMQAGTTCVPNDCRTYPSSPWGTAVGSGAVCAQYVQVMVNKGIPAVIIDFNGIPTDACVNLTNAITQSNDVLVVVINGTMYGMQTINGGIVYTGGGTPIKMTSAQINTACSAQPLSNVEVGYTPK